MPSVSWTVLPMAWRSAYWPPAEWPATTIALRLGNAFLDASLRRTSSVKSNDVILASPVAAPPERQISQGQLTSLGARTSRQLPPALEAKRGAITTVSSSAPATKAAAVALRK